MRNYMRFLGLASAALIAAAALSACGTGEESPNSEVSSDLPTMTEPTFVSLDIKTLLTSEEVSQIVGQAVGEAEEYDQGTTLRFTLTENTERYVEFLLQDADRTAFDTMLENFSDLKEAPNLGEAAWWQAGQKTLLVFQGSHMISIIAELPGKDDTVLVMARELASKVLERL